jgi:hypothetical protein
MAQGGAATTTTGNGDNAVFFRAEDGSSSQHELRERLADPEQRASLRAEHREQLRRFRPDLGEALGIDTDTETALLDMLAEQQLEQLEESRDRLAVSGAGAASAWDQQTQMHAAHETRRVAALRALLGQDGLERYQAYTRTLVERTQVAQFDERLDSADKLTREQKERLVAVYGEHAARNGAQQRAMSYERRSLIQPLGRPPSAEELRTLSELSTIAANEEIWRQMPAQDRALREDAAAVLTPTQLDALERLQDERAAGLRRWIEQARAAAGLDPTIPAKSDVRFASTPRAAVRAGDVRVRIRLSVDGEEPVVSTQVVHNGRAMELTSASGLLVRAVPTLYEDDTFDVRMTYYEQATHGRRPIGEMGQMGTVTRKSGAFGVGESYGGAATVVTGNKGYAIEVSAQVEPL